MTKSPIDECPSCRADLTAGPAPGGGYYTDMIGVEVRGVYDGVLFWQCPRCDHRWHRFEPGTRLHAAAERYMHPRTEEAQ